MTTQPSDTPETDKLYQPTSETFARIPTNIQYKHACNLERQRDKAVRLLQECANAIQQECDAAGADDVKEHPVLRAHQKTANKARAFLARLEKEKP